MAQQYAGILGPLAFATMIVRALLVSEGTAAAVWQATLALAAGAGAGLLMGAAAELIVRDSVRAILAGQLREAGGPLREAGQGAGRRG